MPTQLFKKIQRMYVPGHFKFVFDYMRYHERSKSIWLKFTEQNKIIKT